MTHHPASVSARVHRSSDLLARCSARRHRTLGCCGAKCQDRCRPRRHSASSAAPNSTSAPACSPRLMCCVNTVQACWARPPCWVTARKRRAAASPSRRASASSRSRSMRAFVGASLPQVQRVERARPREAFDLLQRICDGRRIHPTLGNVVAAIRHPDGRAGLRLRRRCRRASATGGRCPPRAPRNSTGKFTGAPDQACDLSHSPRRHRSRGPHPALGPAGAAPPGCAGSARS